MTTTFSLDERLAQDSHYVCDLPLCQVRLENVRDFMWLILVPRLDNVTEVHQLSHEQQQQLICESSQCAQLLLAHFALDKINVGALGNVVSQLHWHVVGRRKDDPAWPRPVWGFAEVDQWTPCEADALVRQLAYSLTNSAEAIEKAVGLCVDG
jgi:diadenosine tetraphosphate (Ap4A) HIT family hydrolase